MSASLYDTPARSLSRPETGSAAAEFLPLAGEMASADQNQPAELRPITLLQPGTILFGNGCASDLTPLLLKRGIRRLLVVTSSAVLENCGATLEAMKSAGIQIILSPRIDTEPALKQIDECLRLARQNAHDGVLGIGGGSAMDVAKLVAALGDSSQSIHEVFGIDQLRGRNRFLACLPTTAGTGSEVSPNAILLDETSQLKKGVISPHLVPDVACVDPLLTLSVPPPVTAATGLDALTHCIEAFVNRYSHPVIDLYALEGIRLIVGALLDAVADGQNREVRSRLALGSLYGGLCLGPVNTAAVHALSYPLGSEFHIAHGISNAVLLPHVLRFNLPAAVGRYARVAVALGVQPTDSARATAERGIDMLAELLRQCPVPDRISELGVPREALPRMAGAAMTITRLLKNNVRELTEEDALQIYLAAY